MVDAQSVAGSGYDPEEVRRALAGRNKQRLPGTEKRDGEIMWYSMPDSGECLLRVLPGWEGAKLPGKFIYTHWDVKCGEKNKTYCLKTWRMDCPVCNLLEEYEGRLDLDNWAAKPKAYMNVLVLKDDTADGRHAVRSGKVHVFGGSENNLWWVLDSLNNPEIGGKILDVHSGHNVTFKRKKFKGAIDKQPSLSPTPIGSSEEKIQEILGQVVNLDKIWKQPDDDYMNMVHDATANLKEILDNKLIVNGGQAGRPSTEPLNESEIPFGAKKDEAPVSDAPKGAPECFGEVDKFYSGLKTSDISKEQRAELSEEGQKQVDVCADCKFEFQCEEDVKRKG